MAILREGGNALEAMIAMATAVAIVYPHIGGHGLWLISKPGKRALAFGPLVQPADSPRRTFMQRTIGGTLSVSATPLAERRH